MSSISRRVSSTCNHGSLTGWRERCGATGSRSIDTCQGTGRTGERSCGSARLSESNCSRRSRSCSCRRGVLDERSATCSLTDDYCGGGACRDGGSCSQGYGYGVTRPSAASVNSVCWSVAATGDYSTSTRRCEADRAAGGCSVQSSKGAGGTCESSRGTARIGEADCSTRSRRGARGGILYQCSAARGLSYNNRGRRTCHGGSSCPAGNDTYCVTCACASVVGGVGWSVSGTANHSTNSSGRE